MTTTVLERPRRYDLPDVSAGMLRHMLRLLVSLMPEEEREAAWASARCPRLPVLEADDLFFSRGVVAVYTEDPGRRHGRDGEALAFCAGCPARVVCALRALEEEASSEYLPVGVVGGLTAAQRRNALAQEAAAHVR